MINSPSLSIKTIAPFVKSKGSIKALLFVMLNICAVGVSATLFYDITEKREVYLKTKESHEQQIATLTELQKRQESLWKTESGVAIEKKLSSPYHENQFTAFLRQQGERRGCQVSITSHKIEPFEVYIKIPYQVQLKCLTDADIFSFIDAIPKKAQNMLVIDKLAVERVQDFSDELFEKALQSKDLWLFEGNIALSVITKQPGRE